MKRVLAILLVIVVVFFAWWFFSKKKSGPSEPKQAAIKIQKHSLEFNQSIANALANYLAIKDAFVDADTVNAKAQTQKFISSVDSLQLNDLKKDDSLILTSVQQQLSDIKANAVAILQESDLTEMRQDFRMVSENLYPFLRTIKYEGTKLYWQNCPMAFGENNEANWISNTSKILNPYLGKKDPAMLVCGETKDSLQ
jgi:Protein of unknown function (DUF3347)